MRELFRLPYMTPTPTRPIPSQIPFQSMTLQSLTGSTGLPAAAFS